MTERHIAIIGAGPAGLTAAYLLSKHNIQVTILEADAQYVGGIARTVKYQDYCFDIGGHRFFSKSAEVEALWQEILPNDMLDRPRSSRIFYRQQFFSYPLKAFEALRKLGIVESSYCILSYLKARLFPLKNPNSFAAWVSNHFGKRLFTIFFKTYTEKVWGMRCEEISADWAAQRIKGLSLFSAIFHAILPHKIRWRKNQTVIKTLIDTFRYPRKGPGMLWEACAQKIIAQKGTILLGKNVYHCAYQAKENNWRIYFRDDNGHENSFIATHIISSAPLRELVTDYLSPAVSPAIFAAARQLRYRDFLIVALILRDKKQFSDNWIYVHDPQVDVARIQNFKSWSEEMVAAKDKCCYGMEYFCFSDETLWSAPDHLLIQKAKQELVQLGLADLEDILDGVVVRQAKAYPVYDQNYHLHVAAIREELELKFPNLYLVGRNGMHKYNNQDHAMMTAMLTVKNILANKREYDVWCVNQDAEYIETASLADKNTWAQGLRHVPEQIN